ncbi:cbpM [Symbiodinium natans]|uniref:CbpM protein n=1 Tax=Symbiodinium natans TaxID=878477 RepID=A0A812S150_9DINO|nr:cbpM [Symbiodinium natans]
MSLAQAENTDQFAGLWEDVRCRKQAIADCAGNCDEQLMTLAQQTHFSVEEIERLRQQFRKMRKSKQETTVLDLKGFKEVVKEAVPEFPPELCGRLFQKLDCFGVGRLTFMELACGMSALALGTMDEKLQVCFDLFDSEGRRALTLKDLNDLCTTLFKVALATGSVNRKASTDEAAPSWVMSHGIGNCARCEPKALRMVCAKLSSPSAQRYQRLPDCAQKLRERPTAAHDAAAGLFKMLFLFCPLVAYPPCSTSA